MTATFHHSKNAHIEELWPIGRIGSIRRFAKGVINKTYKIRAAQGLYVLRVYASKKPRDVASEITLLNHLVDLSVPRVVHGKVGDVAGFNSSPAILYRFLKGTPLRKTDKNQRAEVGAFLARFHEKCSGFRWGGGRFPLYSFSEKRKKLYEKEVRKKLKGKMLEHFSIVARDVCLYAPNSSLPEGPIHADVKPDNVLFKKRKLSGVIDFDNAYRGPLILDLAKSMAWFGIGRKHFSLQKAASIYDGYVSIRKLTPLEYQELYKIMKFAFASHLYVDYYMKATKKIPSSYFAFLVNDFYNSYLSFSKLSEQEFYTLLNKKHD